MKQSIMPKERLRMKVERGTIEDLGVKLYSGFPAALAELVANAWDADAEQINIDTSDEGIVITDDGHGMSRDDIQKKYLMVGYRRRDDGEQRTPKYKRPVMGRKGIGRLALFSIADRIKVYSVKDGEKIGLELSYPAIQEAIREKRDYFPQLINEEEITISCGTKIELSEFRHKSKGLQQRLKERLSRRFSIIGEKYKFKVFVNKEEVSVNDRNYFSNIQFLWTFGDEEKTAEIKKACRNCEKPSHIDQVNGLSGWIGTVFKHGQLKEHSGESLNQIVIMMRGRLAQEDILHSLGQGALGEKYLVGEIYADYLDEDEEDDMATSGRQKLNENDARYEKVKESIKNIVKRACNEWHNRRSKKAKEDILSKNKEIKEWYDELSPDAKRTTDRLLKDTASIDDDERKRNLICCIVPAVEQMSMRSNLDALSEVSLANLEQFSKIFRRQDDIEAMNYYTITEGRLKVVSKLCDYVEKQEIEKVVQKHIYDHLWLLDPSWDRACTSHIEKRVKKRWEEIDSKNNKKVEKIKELRLDIQYKKTSGQHVVIELKRPGRQLDHLTLAQQITDYMEAVSQELKLSGERDNIVEGIIILGTLPTGWSDDSLKMEKGRKTLQAEGIRVITYQEIIRQAEAQYRDYLEAQKKTSTQIQRIESLMKSINV